MKKLVIILIILIAGLSVVKTADASEMAKTSSAKTMFNAAVNSVNDTRVEALRRIFEKYNSPLIDEAYAYVKYADKNGIDWKLLPSIAGLESSFGKRLLAGSYNAYGWGGGHIYFDSWEDGIDTISKSLSKRYYARGATTVWTIGPIYAESPTWAVRVNSFMSKIEAEYAKILRDEITITI